MILKFYVSFSNSPGLSVILLAITMTLICWPLQKYGSSIETKIQEKMVLVDAELSKFKKTLKGEKLFNETERIYKKYKYHPIQSIGMGMSFIVMLPILISAIILLSTHDLLVQQGFLLVPNLSKSDGILGGVNILPILMTSLTIFDAFHRFKDDKKMRNQFLFIAIVLFAIVYNLPSALVIYWTTNVTISMLLAFRKSQSV